MPVPPDDDTIGDGPGGDQPDDSAPLDPTAEDAAPDEADPDEPAWGSELVETPVEEPATRGLVVVVDDTAGMPAAELEPYADADTEGDPPADGRDPARVWKIAVVVLALLALLLGWAAFGGDDEVTAGPPVTSDQEADLEEVANSDADSAEQIEAKRAQLEKLQQEGADRAAAGDQLKADNATLQSDLDAAETRAREAEADATAAVADAEQAADTAAEANRQVSALTAQVESLNREIGSLSSEADRLAEQNAALEKANDDLVAANAQVTAQLTALDGVQQKTYQCTLGLVEAVRQRDDPDWWETNGDATTQACTDAQEALDAYNAEFGR